jgi:hypothetical protein
METIPKPTNPLISKAEVFSRNPALLDAFEEALKNPRLRERALEDAAGYLEKRHVIVPKGLQVDFRTTPSRNLELPPDPDFFPFTIRLFNCRTYWVKKRNKPGFEQVTICFGFEIRGVPFNPRG